MNALVAAGIAFAVLASGLALAPQPVSASCHLPVPDRCDETSQGADCPFSDGAIVVECPRTSLGQQDALTLVVGGIRVVGIASPTVLVEQVDGPHDFPIASIVTLTFSARWVGNDSHPAAVTAMYAFDAHNVTWMSPPGAALDAAPATPGAKDGHPAYPTYAFEFSDWSGANTTFQWTFRIPETATVGVLRLPVAFAVRDGIRERSAQTDIVLHVASQEVSVIPPPPFWRDPAFILMVGCTIGLAVGYILFRRPRPSTARLGGAAA